jgi:hypothetical protein
MQTPMGVGVVGREAGRVELNYKPSGFKKKANFNRN